MTLRGLTLRRSAPGPIGSPSGVMVERADRASLLDLTIGDSYMGITVRASDDVVIERVAISGHGMITGEEHVVDTDADEADHSRHADGNQAAPMRTDAQVRGDGIWLWNAPVAIVRTTTISETRDGIYISYGTGVLIERNRILDSRYAIHDMYAADLTVRDNAFEGNLSGVVLMYGGPVEVSGNSIVDSGSPSTGFGVLVKDAPAFVVNRMLTRQSSVLMQALEAGNTFEETDEAALRLGIPMPPSALLAMVGPRVANHVLHTLHAAFPDRFPLSPTLEALADGELPSLEAGEGRASVEEIHGRILEALADEARHILDEGVVASAAEIDACLILGAGYPFFRGGITKHLDQAGVSERVSGRLLGAA